MRKAKFKKGDTVKLLDGSGIQSYAGMWVTNMRKYIGTETTIEHVQYDKYVNTFRYMVANNDYMWDERGLEAVESKPDWKVLIVPVDGKVTEGRLIENDKVVKTVTTKKSKEDEYSIEEACKVIVERLFEGEVKSTEIDEFPPDTIVKVVNFEPNGTAICNGMLGFIVNKDIDGSYLVDFLIPVPGCHYGVGHELPEKTGYYLFPFHFEKVDV